MHEPSMKNSDVSEDASSRSEQRKQSLAGTPFEVLCQKTTPAGLPKGMQWNSHQGNREMRRRAKRIADAEIADARKRAKQAGFDLEISDEPDRA